MMLENIKKHKVENLGNKIDTVYQDAVMGVDDKLNNESGIDTFLSGTTMCSLLFDQNSIYLGNSGDSRAMMCSYNSEKGNLVSLTILGVKVSGLTNDHKPDLPKEKARVLAKGGRVEPIKSQAGGYLGPHRVWLANEDSPGLAMSRSLGDRQAHIAGVISDPEVTKFSLTPDDKFIVVASDGVWEFLENEAVAKIVWPFFIQHSPEAAGNALVRAAAAKWKEFDTVIDDITCVIIFLEVD
jgi:serine/threonine protein phosphatase PrpC